MAAMAAKGSTDAAPEPQVVMFACIQNAGRSQMAKAFFNLLVDPSSATAISAGSKPAEHVHPEVLEVMQELGVDLSSAAPQKLTRELAEKCQLLVTMGCGEECPVVPGLRVTAWQIPDPHGKPVDAVRQLRDMLREEVQKLARSEGYKLKATA